MKKIIQISFLTVTVMLFFLATGYSQQKASDRSFTSVMNEVNQKRAAHDKMILQMRQTRPSNIVVSNASTQIQPNPKGAIAPSAAQKSLSLPGTNQQPANKLDNSRPKPPIMKKQ